MNHRSILMHDRNFHALLALVSAGFAWVLWPFWSAVFWGTILAIIFSPVQRRLVARLRGRRNLAALLTVLLVLVVAILPLAFIAGSLVTEGAALYQRVRSGNLDVGAYFQQAQAALPGWAHDLLARFDLTDLDGLRDKLSEGVMQVSRFLATRAFSLGQDTFQFVINLGIMLYLLFFLLRDGPTLSRRMLSAIPLSDEHKEPLMQKFTTVVRATVKGNVTVAAVQGVLGGFILWVLGIQGALLWGVVMGFLSLLPAIGSALVWVPVVAYFLLTGALWQGIVLILFCVLVIGMVDNLLRPLLVGKETKLPDYVILISTMGGMALVGLNGFVIGPLVAALFMACWDLFSPHEA